MAKKHDRTFSAEELQQQEEERLRLEEGGGSSNGLVDTAEDQAARENQAIEDMLKAQDLEGGTMRLSRRGPSDSHYKYLSKFRIKEFELEMVKRVYGGGDYVGQCYRINGQLGKKIEFSIDPRFKGAIEIEEGKTEKSADPVAMFRAVAEVVARDKKPDDSNNMKLIMDAQTKASENMMLMMQENSKLMMGMMSGMMTAMAQAMSGNKHAPTPMSEIIPLLTLMKASDKPQMTMLEMVETMKGLREVSGDAPAEREKTKFEQILEALPHVGGVITAIRGGQPEQPSLPAPAAKAAITAGAESAKVAQPGKPAASSEANDLMVLLNTLVLGAKKDGDVDLYHDLVLDTLTDDQVPMFKQVLTEANWFDLLFGKLPEATAIRPWMTKLRDLLLTSLNTPNPTHAQPAADSAVNPTGVRPDEGAAGAVAN